MSDNFALFQLIKFHFSPARTLSLSLSLSLSFPSSKRFTRGGSSPAGSMVDHRRDSERAARLDNFIAAGS